MDDLDAEVISLDVGAHPVLALIGHMREVSHARFVMRCMTGESRDRVRKFLYGVKLLCLIDFLLTGWASARIPSFDDVELERDAIFHLRFSGFRRKVLIGLICFSKTTCG